MAELIVAGTSQFILGFQLAGIKKTIKIEEDKNPSEVIGPLLEEKQAGILIIDEATMERVDEFERAEIENSIQPVVITLSTTENQGSLRKQIIRAIGVDLMAQEDEEEN